MQKKHNATFKAQVALEAIKGNETLAELSKRYNIHPRQIQTWKAAAIAGLEKVFTKENNGNKKSEEEVANLERKIGQLVVDNDFLKKSLLKFPKKTA